MRKQSQIIKQLRESCGLSQSQLAESSGLSLAYIMKIEEGVSKSPSLKTFKKLSEGFSMSLREFLEILGCLEETKKRPSLELITQSLRTGGYKKQEIDKILEYAEYIRTTTKNKRR